MHIPDAAENIIPYEIYPTQVGSKKILKAKRLNTALDLCTGSPQSVADKLKFARLSAGLHQDVLADIIGIDRATLLRYENGQVEEENMQVEWLMQIASICGTDKYYCCSPYHIFLLNDAGKQIKQYRKNIKLTQKKLAAKLGVDETTVKRWEQNKCKPPKYIVELVNNFNSTD